jgi:hypothetical protein
MDDYGFDSGSDSGSSLIASLAANATSAYETTQALNANPLNTALLYGGSASTSQGAAQGAPASTISAAAGGIGTWLLVGAVVVIAVVSFRK